MNRLTVIVCVVLSAASAYTQEKVTFCDLVRNPGKYNGKEVTVRAILTIGFEWSLLHCPECSDRGKAWLNLPTDLDDDKISRKALKRIPGAGIVTLTVTGRFASGGTYGHMNACRYQLTATRVQDIVVLSKGMKAPDAERKIEVRSACGGSKSE